MPTSLFIRHPELWLTTAAVQRHTVLSSPNFGFKYYLDHADRLGRIEPSLDLSAVRLIFNGAEPISYELCQRFLKALGPYGLKPGAMFPVYGLAEATLAVSFPRLGEPLQRIAVDRRSLGMKESAQADQS